MGMRCDAMRPWLAAVGVGRAFWCKAGSEFAERLSDRAECQMKKVRKLA